MRRLRRFGFNLIKEGFDQLPTAICFFDSRGSIVLCNRQMYRLSHYLFESDMQYLGEVERALASPPEGIRQLSNMEGTYRFPDNTIWQFEKTEVTDRYGETYIQLTAADVTELCHVLGLLFVENKKAREIFHSRAFSYYFMPLRYSYAFNACSISAIISSAFSIPTDRRIKSGRTPASISCSSVNWR